MNRGSGAEALWVLLSQMGVSGGNTEVSRALAPQLPRARRTVHSAQSLVHSPLLVRGTGERCANFVPEVTCDCADLCTSARCPTLVLLFDRSPDISNYTVGISMKG